MKKAVWVLAFLVAGNAFAAGETTGATSGSVVGSGAQRAMQASFGSMNVASLTLGAVLWSAVVVSAKPTTGTTGTN